MTSRYLHSCKSRIFEATLLREFCGSADDLEYAVGRDLHPDTVAMLGNKDIQLGDEGISRCVFSRSDDPDTVIKVDARGTANEAEAFAWDVVKTHADLAPWFAPVRWISPDKHVLVQDRASGCGKDGLPQSEFPDAMPALFDAMPDMHRANFGMIGRQIVCLDYPEPDMARRIADAGKPRMMAVVFHVPGSKWPAFREIEGNDGAE